MALHRSMSQRKVASTFEEDGDDVVTVTNSMQLNTAQKNACLLEKSKLQETKANLLRQPITAKDRRHAVFVVKTRENGVFEFQDISLRKTSSNPFIIVSPGNASSSLERISEKSLAQLSPTDNNDFDSNSKLKRKPKHSKCCAIPRHRLASFTSRHSQLQAINYSTNSKKQSIETQTDNSNNKSNKFTNTTSLLKYIPIEGPQNYNPVFALKRPDGLYHRQATLPKMPPLQTHTQSKCVIGSYSELYLSVLIVLVILIFWQLFTYFDVTSWFFLKRKPKNTLEILLTYFWNLFS